MRANRILANLSMAGWMAAALAAGTEGLSQVFGGPHFWILGIFFWPGIGLGIGGAIGAFATRRAPAKAKGQVALYAAVALGICSLLLAAYGTLMALGGQDPHRIGGLSVVLLALALVFVAWFVWIRSTTWQFTTLKD
jgi:hypothetical protein